MKLKFSLFSVCLLLVAAQISFSQNKDEKVVDEFISAQAKERKVEEYKYVRTMLRADVNADGREDLVVLYMLHKLTTMLGYEQCLAVFLGEGESFRYADQTVVSGIVKKSIELEEVVDGVIRLDTLEFFKKGDAHYRMIGELKFVFSDGKLQRTNKRIKRRT